MKTLIELFIILGKFLFVMLACKHNQLEYDVKVSSKTFMSLYLMLDNSIIGILSFIFPTWSGLVVLAASANIKSVSFTNSLLTIQAVPL